MISVCIIAKNASQHIAMTINSVKLISTEIIVVDDHSTDNTKDIAKELGAIVIDLPFEITDIGFAHAVNWMESHSTKEWILQIDADEILDFQEKLFPLTRYIDKEVWALPRRKWNNYKLQQREEIEAYPDWQIRFFKNNPEKNCWDGEMHTRFRNKNVYYAYNGPHIEHLQKEHRTPEILLQREELYNKLSPIQGVAIVGGHLLEKEKNE
jgi:glycosyltransferase involved in cell wall biosynthesis